jgi:hypothetical protein
MAYLSSLISALLLTRDAATDADFLSRRTVGLWFQIKEAFNITKYADPVKKITKYKLTNVYYEGSLCKT